MIAAVCDYCDGIVQRDVDLLADVGPGPHYCCAECREADRDEVDR